MRVDAGRVSISIHDPIFARSGATMRPFFISLILAIFVPSTVHAGAVFDRLSGSEARADLCFARFYNADHLKRHPRQRVTRFQLRRERSGPENNPTRFTVAIGFRTTGGPELFEVHGICTTRGAIAECAGEGDAGRFRLALDRASLRVEIDRLEVEGSGADLAESDDRIFLLRPEQLQQCQG